MGDKGQTTATAALSEDWLSRPEKIDEYYASLRDRFEPGKPCGSPKQPMQHVGEIPGLQRSSIRFVI